MHRTVVAVLAETTSSGGGFPTALVVGLLLVGIAAVSGGIWFAARRSRERAVPESESPGGPSPAPSPRPPAATPQPTGQAAIRPTTRSVFICYRREDSADVTGRIRDRLAAELGSERVFADVDSIPVGEDFRHQIALAIARSDAMVVVIGRGWLDSADPDGRRRIDHGADLVRYEIESGLRENLRVVPVLVQGASMPSPEELPEPIRDLAFRNGLAVGRDPDFHRDVDRLLRALQGSDTPPPA